MSDLNKVFLTGRLGQNPELRVTQSGQSVCNFSVATSRKWTQNGQSQEVTTWHKVVTWGKLAEICSQYLKKGSKVFIEAEISHRNFTGKDGVSREITEIIAHSVQFLDSSRNNNQQSNDQAYAPDGTPYTEDNIPF